MHTHMYINPDRSAERKMQVMAQGCFPCGDPPSFQDAATDNSLMPSVVKMKQEKELMLWGFVITL